MKKIALVLALSLVLALLCSCGSPSIVGTWSATTELLGTEYETTYVFNSDGTGSESVLGITASFTYTVEGDTVTLVASILGTETTETFTYSVEGDTLTLTSDGETLTLNRK